MDLLLIGLAPNGHMEQVVASKVELYVLFRHGVQFVEPGVLEIVPGEHGIHVSELGTDEYVPAEQAMH